MQAEKRAISFGDQSSATEKHAGGSDNDLGIFARKIGAGKSRRDPVRKGKESVWLTEGVVSPEWVRQVVQL